jgi:colanic acid biosynthesis glycosyl transferase WcaI
MKILFVHGGYWPYVGAATNRVLTDLAEYLAAEGHEVHVICSGPNPKPQDPAAPTNQKIHNGVHIHRVATFGFPGFGVAHWSSSIALLNFFLVSGILMLLRSYQFDVIVTLDYPPGLGVWGTLAQWITFGKTRHVCWIMDMITESRFQLGVWQRNCWKHWLIDFLHILPSRFAALNIVLGDCMRDRLSHRGIEKTRTQKIGIWHYSSVVAPITSTEKPAFLKPELAEKFIVMYSGNAGVMHSFDAVQDAMFSLREDCTIQFVFVGDSAAISKLENFAATNHLTNFTRLDPVAWEALNQLLSAGAVHLVTLREGMQGICVPSKLYGIMAAGKPVIFVGPQESQAAKDILAGQAGFVIPTSDSEKLVSVLRHLASSPSECDRLGNNAYDSFSKNHDCPIRCQQWEHTLQALLSKSD